MTAGLRAKLVFDADMNAAILSGLRRRLPDLDVVWVRENGMAQTLDPDVLEWAAAEGRATVSHDASTMTYFAGLRIQAGMGCPGLVVVPQKHPVGPAINDLVRLVELSPVEPLDDRIVFVPLDKSWRVSEDAADWVATYA